MPSSLDSSIFPDPGSDGQHEKVQVDPEQINRISGISGELSDDESGLHSTKTEKNPTGCTETPRSGDCVSARTGKVLGKATAASRAVWQATLHYRALQNMENAVMPESHTQPDLMQKFSAVVKLTKEAVEYLTWWTSLSNTVVEAPLYPRVPQVIIKLDASNRGWGTHQGDLSTGGMWSTEEAGHHINYLELLAAFLTLIGVAVGGARGAIAPPLFQK